MILFVPLGRLLNLVKLRNLECIPLPLSDWVSLQFSLMLDYRSSGLDSVSVLTKVS